MVKAPPAEAELVVEMGTDSSAQGPTIIKRKKVYKADGHHGGAWKVAYADFVTAMMAFFLLMWLLNATTEEQRKGIADYFSPTIPISRISGGGSDGLNGSSIFAENTYAKMGMGANRKESVENPSFGDSKQRDSESEAADAAAKQAEERQIAAELQELKESLGEQSRQLSEHLLIKMSAEGIVLEITDSESTPLFPLGRSEPSDTMMQLMDVVAEAFGEFDNDIKIVGHTDSHRYRNGAIYDNWNLSADRANAARRLLERAGVPGDRIREVSGKADTDPLVKEDTQAAQNRRISITILTE
ncbi:flagellar motor protein MotB [Hyphomonas sp. CACIAM 19H1]|uniref:flagellar motor protein MotB n=1 Tax=Hyphomonas sp. CACIAM 19H1 TaxID=1873716 RepID=UPI001F1C1F7D|nr:flagellar motor protein MotB [Hyphomonas sp. CACIAM 19H1]